MRKVTSGLCAALLLALAACTSHDPARPRSGIPRYGGTLHVVGDADIDHVDTASAYSTLADTVERAFTRQLVSYPATGVHTMPTSPVPDLATAVPTPANGGVTDGGTTFTYTLRPGVQWDSTPPRPVTSQDVVRGFKRLCNPVSPAGALGYYVNTIAGMASYCAAFQHVTGTTAAINSFMNSHDISGIRVVDQSTVTFHLLHPATDFNNILAMPFSSPAPVEYLRYAPGSRQQAQHTLSDGPYRIADYRPGTRIVLDRNPAWRQSADPIRHAYVDHIVITEGTNAASVLMQLKSGTADLMWDTDIPVADLDRLLASHDPRLEIYSSSAMSPYLVVNFQSPNADHATSKLGVRQAVEYAVDKAAVVQLSGGPKLSAPLDQIITRGNVGYRPFNLYPTPSHHGDPARARRLLEATGYHDNLTLKLLYPNDARSSQIAQVLHEDLNRAGIKVMLLPTAIGEFYGIVVTPSAARAGKWDLALTGWAPDWFGDNGRATVQPLLDGSAYGPGATNFGDYDSDRENSLIVRALAAPTPEEAAARWHQADVNAMKDAALVPLVVGKKAVFHSARVQHWRVDPVSWTGDVTALWLAPS